MSSIPVINKLSPQQWQSVCADERLSEAYRAENGSKKLEGEFANRIKVLCEKNALPLPKKITITYEINGPTKVMNSGELRVHPLSFFASNLGRSSMTAKQQAFYGRLEKYVEETEALHEFYTNPLNKKNATRADRAEYEQKKQKIFDEYRAELVSDIKDYEYVVTGAELDEMNRNLLLMHKACKYHTIPPTLAKLAILSVTVLNGFGTNWGLNKLLPVSMWPLSAAMGLIMGGVSFVGLSVAENVYRIAAQVNDPALQAVFWQPLKERPLDSKINWAKLELLKGQMLAKG